MSRFPLFDLARDAALAVGAYVGVLREHVKAEWATVLGGSFDERVEEAKARMEAQADMLADKEADEEVSEPQACPDCDGVWLNGVGECPESSPVAEAAVGGPRSGETPRPAPGHSAMSTAVDCYWEALTPEAEKAAINGIASIRAMQMICATTSSGKPSTIQLADIRKIVDAWVFKPSELTPTAMLEDLPEPRK